MIHLIPLILGCASKQDDTGARCEGGETRIYLVDQLSYARVDDGVAWGFDLDSRTSDSDDPGGCFRPDLVDPLGNRGIDNAFSEVIHTLGAS